MKVHVNTDGSMDFDVQCESDLALLRKATAKENGKAENSTVASLNVLQYETWSWLVEHDNEQGVHYMTYAREKNMNESTANNRLARLVRMNAAEALGGGRFRAKC